MQPNFWQYFIQLFSGMPPEVGQFVASVLGGAVGLVFFPPTDWRGGVSQVFVSWVVSHYFSGIVQKRYVEDWTIEAVRVLMAFAGWSLVSLLAALLKRLNRNPDAALTMLDKLLDFLANLRKPKNDA